MYITLFPKHFCPQVQINDFGMKGMCGIFIAWTKFRSELLLKQHKHTVPTGLWIGAKYALYVPS